MLYPQFPGIAFSHGPSSTTYFANWLGEFVPQFLREKTCTFHYSKDIQGWPSNTIKTYGRNISWMVVSTPLKKNEFVSWDDYSQLYGKNKSPVPNCQPVSMFSVNYENIHLTRLQQQIPMATVEQARHFTASAWQPGSSFDAVEGSDSHAHPGRETSAMASGEMPPRSRKNLEGIRWSVMKCWGNYGKRMETMEKKWSWSVEQNTLGEC